MKEVGKHFAVEMFAAIRVRKNLIAHELLEQLPMINLLLDRARTQKPVHRNIFLLPNPPASLSRLQIRAWIPIRIVDNDAVGTNEIEANAAGFGGQHEGKYAAVVVVLQNSVDTASKSSNKMG
jgi:hypothetical protein